MAMNKNDAIQGFVNNNERFSDYWSMQLAWTCHMDWLFSEHMITERQRQNWSNPCTPETFKRWSNKWYGLRSSYVRQISC